MRNYDLGRNYDLKSGNYDLGRGGMGWFVISCEWHQKLRLQEINATSVNKYPRRAAPPNGGSFFHLRKPSGIIDYEVCFCENVVFLKFKRSRRGGVTDRQASSLDLHAALWSTSTSSGGPHADFRGAEISRFVGSGQLSNNARCSAGKYVCYFPVAPFYTQIRKDQLENHNFFKNPSIMKKT